MSLTFKNQSQKMVFGKITNAKGHPLANLKVAIYDVDMREWYPLSDTLTNKEGKYQLKWTPDQVSSLGKKEADIGLMVFTKETGTAVFKSNMDEVRFNASEREEINVTIVQELPKELIEFDYLVKEVSFLANKIAIADLQENEELRDVTFLSKELEVPADKMEHLVVAHRLQQVSRIDAAFFYALFRKNTLLHNDFAKNLRARISIGIGVEDQTLLYEVAVTESKKIIADVKNAAEEMIISPDIAQQVKGYLETLLQFREKAGEYYAKEHPQKAINLFTNIFKTGKLQEIQQLFKEQKDKLPNFFDQLTNPAFYASKEQEVEAENNGQLGKLFGFGNEVVPQIARLKGILKPEDTSKLAKLNKAEWVEEITKARPDLKDPQFISTYASSMVRKMEKQFPTLAFAAQLERTNKVVLKNQETIVSFFNKHQDFDLMKHNVDLYLKEKQLDAKDKEAIRDELKSVQRIFKLVPNYSKTLALRDEKIHSAQSIVAIGQTRFVNEIAPKAGMDEKEAREIYRKAENKHTAAMLMVGDLQDSMSVMNIASFETRTLANKLEAVSKDFPNLKSLFKLVDTCECEHCRSVYSPAAYLVEILQFLDKRMVVANNAKAVLFKRRPELGEIDLSCANANTPVKYIDLVCEILEEAIAPEMGLDFSGQVFNETVVNGQKQSIITDDLKNFLISKGKNLTDQAKIFGTETSSGIAAPFYVRDANLVCKITGNGPYRIFPLKQTLSSEKELDAAPEYVNAAAYEELRNKAFAFKLPFDLPHTEAKAYLNRFDVDRADLMKAFQTAAIPSNENIATERLGLTATEWDIIANAPTPNDNAAQQQYWNVPAPGNVVDHLKQVDHFLDRTGITYKELDLLLKLNFIDKKGNLFIRHNDLTCDTEKKEIVHLDLTVLDRIHRFLRLQKKLGWKYEVLDEIISQANLGNGDLNDGCLLKAAQLKEISEKTTIQMEELIGCFGELPHASILASDEKSPKSLYHQLFLNKGKNGLLDEGLLPEKVDGSQLLTTYLGYIATCLQLKQRDLELITALLPDVKLTFPNLSVLFAASKLMIKLQLQAADLVVLLQLSGRTISSSPDQTLELMEAMEQFKDSPLSASDVWFILNHEANNLNDREIKLEKIEDVLGKLKTGYEKINQGLKSSFDVKLSASEQKESVIAALSGLKGKADGAGMVMEITNEQVQAIVKLLDEHWTNAPDPVRAANIVEAKNTITNKYLDQLEKTNIIAAVDSLGALVQHADSRAEQINLVKELLGAISQYQIASAKQALLEQTLSTAFKIELALAATVVKHAKLKQTAPGTDSIFNLLLDNFDHPITIADDAKQYAAIQLLHKIFALLQPFKLSNTDTEWFFKNNAAMGCLEFDGIPYESGQTAIAFDKYLAFCRMVAYSKQFTAVANPLDAETPISYFTMADLILQGVAANRDEFLHQMACLTGYEKELLDAIDAHLFGTFDMDNYLQPENWKRLLDGAHFARKLGAEVSSISNYIQPVLTELEVNDLRTNLKSRYDEDTWLSTLKEIMDAIRPQKRDALVAYLLATNTGVKDENDLYEHFLVDVEMEACMPSSRIVLAHNSIQLFVQRCLMGLEPDAVADVEQDPNWNQWKWMKNYRVWEANRKVFLYPENWYDVSLTDDKTYLLTEFINEIQQNELTNDTAEEAIKKYLEKLDNIAFLEVMATWYDVPSRNMHVFARTKGGDPAIYYYRRFENERYWTPWEKVELDISGDLLLAFMRNNRLHLAWPMFSEETKPDQQAKIPSIAEQENGYATTEQPKKKLKIQLAISAYSNKKWQSKKVSSDAILTPTDYTDAESLLRRDKFNLSYLPSTDQIWIFSSSWEGVDYHRKRGVFDLAGCKGYPELVFQGDDSFPDFLPDFKDAELKTQKYVERPLVPNAPPRVNPDDLSVRNGMAPFEYYQILGTTPGKFRITYPHQFTGLDLIGLMYQFFQIMIHTGLKSVKRNQYKIPLGTMLPYFKEDSNHAYVIIPGFYKKVMDAGELVATYTLNDSEKRTASNVFKLLDDITNWFKKISQEFQENPPADMDAAVQTILSDPGFNEILLELSKYEQLDVLLKLLNGKISNDEFDKQVNEVGLTYGEQFKNMYHPLVCALRSALYGKNGVSDLMKRDTQMQQTSFDFKSHYHPNAQIVPQTFVKKEDGTQTLGYPVEEVDFNADGSYSAYNWDLFFRVPLHIATSLTKNQRFEEAMTWFHFMFNPTGALPGTGVQKYWVTKPFYLNQSTDYVSQRIDSLMYATANLSNPNIKELEFAIEEWRNKPFKPDVIARFRPVAYQKALLMKYIDNLTEWGDYLFRQDTMESIAQATQLYILADKLLGPKPRVIPAAIKQPYETYNQLEAKLDSFGNALVELENILPDLSVMPEAGNELPASPSTLSLLYFCIPANDKMEEYWNRVADRLFKIRHCQNMEGVERSLALFAPPIDPGMLVRAAASGLDLSSVIAGLNAPTPHYRFQVLAQKATELAQEVRGLGNSLLQTLEKKDAESLALLRSELELKVLNAVKDIKKLQINESREQIEILNRSRKVTEERLRYYASIKKILPKEQLNLEKLDEAHGFQIAAQMADTLGGLMSLLPDLSGGASGFGGSPHVVVQWGGLNLLGAAKSTADVFRLFSSMASYEANRASILGGYERRFDDWKLQERLATKELASIEKQMVAANIRKDIAETDLKNHMQQMDNAKKTDDFMRSKFTNQELYDWMIGQISSVYFSSYKLLHDVAKKAEQSYRFELGNDDAFIFYGYWDSMKKGLLSADHLMHDLKRMETSYLDKNKREYEITKHVSLAQLDPLALVRLRATGICDFEIPEALYDMDHPGQYFRRLKSVSISLPCIAGPYTSVSAKLSLVNNRYRKNTDNPASYAEDQLAGDSRFRYNVGSIQSIATSNAQNDSGVFELNFRDERYLPFENTGAISSWRLELPTEVRQFDYHTLSDAIIHVKYTAREGGSGLKTAANASLKGQLEKIKQDLSQNGLHMAINMKQDLAKEWLLLKKNGTIDLTIDKSRLPYMVQSFETAEIEEVIFLGKIKDNPATFSIGIKGAATNLARVDALKLCKGTNTTIDLDAPFALSVSDTDKLEELMMVVKYRF